MGEFMARLWHTQHPNALINGHRRMRQPGNAHIGRGEPSVGGDVVSHALRFDLIKVILTRLIITSSIIRLIARHTSPPQTRIADPSGVSAPLGLLKVLGNGDGSTEQSVAPPKSSTSSTSTLELEEPSPPAMKVMGAAFNWRVTQLK